jgi:hypothetical protein
MNRLLFFPQIKILTAHDGFKGKCPRCQKKFQPGDQYVDHCEGFVHQKCLRSGKTKQYVGRERRTA